MIEYAGELVRPSVAEARERRSYNSLVGCGTYIFRLNAKECVDATKAGNLAHLLNHSCEPNCFSRSVPIWDAASMKHIDRVVIFAARTIHAGEELTYDYRFCGDEILRCDCGAQKCRGYVNASKGRSAVRPSGFSSNGVVDVDGGADGILVPKSLVTRVRCC